MLRTRSRGVTLIDTVVGTALMLLVFAGIAAAFQLSIDVVSNNKARAGAIALANERMEYLRSLSYSALGTAGGIPAGALAQSEIETLNGVPYVRRTVIEYADDPKDGTGAADQNGITSDYKAAKVDVSWSSRSGTRHITVVSRFEPSTGMEISCTPPCGTLVVNAVNASSSPVVNAQVRITNASASPAVDLTTYTNASGTVSIIGAPAASNYSVVVSKSGYSTAQTYSATAQNTNPSPANLTVSNNQTTAATFAIDLLSQKIVQSFTPIQSATSTDSFSDDSRIATSTHITVEGGAATLEGGASDGEFQTTSVAPGYLSRWNAISISATKPSGSSVLYRIYDGSSLALITDAELPGNSAGFTAGSINLSGVSASTHPSLRLDAVLDGDPPPSIDSWSIGYDYGPTPLANVSFTLTGATSIGSGPSGTIYAYQQVFSTGASGSISVPSLAWDTYTISVPASSGYDLAGSCGPQPESLLPGTAPTTALYLMPHTTNSLLVDVRAVATGALMPGATVNIKKTGYSATSTTDACGQAFFSGLSAATYTATISASGHTNATSDVTVSGATRLSTALN
jgi:hypothetical protein